MESQNGKESSTAMTPPRKDDGVEVETPALAPAPPTSVPSKQPPEEQKKQQQQRQDIHLTTSGSPEGEGVKSKTSWESEEDIDLLSLGDGTTADDEVAVLTDVSSLASSVLEHQTQQYRRAASPRHGTTVVVGNPSEFLPPALGLTPPRIQRPFSPYYTIPNHHRRQPTSSRHSTNYDTDSSGLSSPVNTVAEEFSFDPSPRADTGSTPVESTDDETAADNSEASAAAVVGVWDRLYRDARHRHTRRIEQDHLRQFQDQGSVYSSSTVTSSSSAATGKSSVPVWDRLYHDARERRERRSPKQEAPPPPPQQPPKQQVQRGRNPYRESEDERELSAYSLPTNLAVGQRRSLTPRQRKRVIEHQQHRRRSARQSAEEEKKVDSEDSTYSSASASAYSLPNNLALPATATDPSATIRTSDRVPVWDRLYQDAQQRRVQSIQEAFAINLSQQTSKTAAKKETLKGRSGSIRKGDDVFERLYRNQHRREKPQKKTKETEAPQEKNTKPKQDKVRRKNSLKAKQAPANPSQPKQKRTTAGSARTSLTSKSSSTNRNPARRPSQSRRSPRSESSTGGGGGVSSVEKSSSTTANPPRRPSQSRKSLRNESSTGGDGGASSVEKASSTTANPPRRPSQSRKSLRRESSKGGGALSVATSSSRTTSGASRKTKKKNEDRKEQSTEVVTSSSPASAVSPTTTISDGSASSSNSAGAFFSAQPKQSQSSPSSSSPKQQQDKEESPDDVLDQLLDPLVLPALEKYTQAAIAVQQWWRGPSPSQPTTTDPATNNDTSAPRPKTPAGDDEQLPSFTTTPTSTTTWTSCSTDVETTNPQAGRAATATIPANQNHA